jgi:integrase/recombinase XerD
MFRSNRCDQKREISEKRLGEPLYQESIEELSHGVNSSKTIKAYLSCLRSFVRHFRPRLPRELTNEDLRAYLIHLIEKEKYQFSSINQVINAIRFLYVDLYKRELRLDDLPRPRKERKLPEVLSEEEVMRIFNAVDNLKHKAILMLIYSAGLRVGEAVRIRLSDVDEQRKLIHLHKAKGAKDGYTLLSTSLLETLAGYLREYRPREFLFEGQGGRRQYSERSVQHIFERAANDAGILKPVSVHTFRHLAREIRSNKKETRWLSFTSMYFYPTRIASSTQVIRPT